MVRNRKQLIWIISLSIICILILFVVIYQYILTGNKLVIMIGGLISAIIGKVIVTQRLKYKGEYYRFKIGKNKILGNPSAKELKMDLQLSDPKIYQNKYYPTLNLIGNLFIQLIGVLLGFLFWEFDFDFVFYFVPIILFFYGLVHIIKNRDRESSNTRLILSKDGIWTEKLGNTSWISIKEVNMILFYTGIRGIKHLIWFLKMQYKLMFNL